MSRSQYTHSWETHSKALQMKYLELMKMKNVG